MKLIQLLILAALFTSCTTGDGEDQKAKETKPNIVLIFIDDMGYADIGSFGAVDYKTPNIDHLAEGGMKFTNFYASQAVCSASRASLLTACYAERVGVTGALMPWSNIGLNDDETTIAEMLKNEGYATAIFGKWHLGDQKRFLPLQHGFDDYVGLPYSNDMWPVDFSGEPLNKGERKSNYPPLPLIDGNDVIDTIACLADQGKLTQLYTQKAVGFIENHKDEPFFLYLPHSMVHVPIAVSDNFKGKSGKGLFADVMMELDWSVGEVMKTLKENDLLENTLVIFTSDNGPWLNFGNHAGSALPLREGKGTMWEGGPRVSTIMYWPHRIQASSVCDKIASTIDVLPTISEITGAELPKNTIDGVSILPLLRGDKDAYPRRIFYYYYGKRLIAVRKDQWKLVLPHSGRSYKGQKPGKDGYPGPTAIFTVHHHELYDLDNDISETVDLSEKYPQIVADLERIADSARQELGDKIKNIKGAGVREPGRVFIAETKVENIAKGKAIHISGEVGFDYACEGDKTLINGVLGSLDFADGKSLGYQGQDIEILIDLEKETIIHEIESRFLVKQGAWIFSPKKISFQLSADGNDYRTIRIIKTGAAKEKANEEFVTYSVLIKNQKARYIQLKIESINELPPWHPSAGGKPWIFMDEIIIK